MPDMLNIGSSALLSYKRALDTVSNNIANANTPGYSRQRAELVTQAGQPTGAGTIGNGVRVATISRSGDALLQVRVQSDASALGRAQQYANYAGRVDQLLSDPATGINNQLKGFFDAANALSQDPSNMTLRQQFLGGAEALTSKLGATQAQLDAMDAELGSRLGNTVDELNSMTRALAEVNRQITDGYARGGGNAPNDLLDKRDELLNEISARIGITTAAQDGGGVNVFTATGQPLVLGFESTPLGIGDPYNTGRVEITHLGSNITNELSGGAIGGLLDARREVLDPARAQLGRIAVGLAEAANAVHENGVDATGAPGTALFGFGTPPGSVSALDTPAVVGASSNTGNATVSVAIDDLQKLGDSTFELRFSGSPATPKLFDLRSGQEVDPVAMGLDLSISGTGSAGDRFLIEPSSRAAGGISVLISDPAQVAAAGAGSLANSSDNRAALELADLGNKAIFKNGGTLNKTHIDLVANAGQRALIANQNLSAQTAISQNTFAERESVAGVSLDEEAADLIRYQQAYQAAARVIQVSDTLFQTILQAVR
ncbi:flagellar hook-associated protein FlgK [Sinimarinibacterium sp. NLF-5-8]|uniref:flagellar hook-associated protein FlgK n=1 Tax=Sinimarinibacterium sp. NLF-5-8 TaxID=2698684 RepID=UPI00137C27F7|nr:flagellar hook-associated protein FlgK [Sinimarinibacterium sp. NLF-5-8]QHS10009.1 flagellar hook-associated protein FlgK [Sinimarinibacterium sp. NLF-5-8]